MRFWTLKSKAILCQRASLFTRFQLTYALLTLNTTEKKHYSNVI